jgi:hypothetical protein
MEPDDWNGAAHWFLIGVGASLVALVVSVFFPGLIPQRATQAKL